VYRIKSVKCLLYLHKRLRTRISLDSLAVVLAVGRPNFQRSGTAGPHRSDVRANKVTGGGVPAGLARTSRPGPGRPWPGGRKVAVWVALNMECFVPGQVGPSLQPHLAHGEDIANYGWREYGNRAGFWRLLDALSELTVPVTAAVNAEMCDRHPDIVRAIVGADWAIVAHGLENSTPHYGLTPDAERDRIVRTVTMLSDATGRQPIGWLTPGFAVTKATHQLLHEAGLRYTADRCDADVPYWLESPSGRLLAVPYSLETNDISMLLCMRYTAEQFADAVVAHVTQLCAEPSGTVVGIGLHTYLVGQPGRLASLRACLQSLAAMPDVWLCTGDEICMYVTGDEAP
jgi:allantoinase